MASRRLKSGAPDQNTLPLSLTQRRRPTKKQSAYIPESLRVHSVKHSTAQIERLPAKILLTYAGSYADSKLPIALSPEAAAYLLEIFIPCVSINGDERALIGQTEIFCALLSELDPATEVAVRYIDASNPFSQVRLPLHVLFPSIDLIDQISVINDLVMMLSGVELSQVKLAKLTGKDRSSISKALSKSSASTDNSLDE